MRNTAAPAAASTLAALLFPLLVLAVARVITANFLCYLYAVYTYLCAYMFLVNFSFALAAGNYNKSKVMKVVENPLKMFYLNMLYLESVGSVGSVLTENL